MPEQWAVEPAQLHKGGLTLRELRLETDDVPRPNHVVIRLRIPSPVPIDEPDPLRLMDLPQPPAKFPPQVLLVGYPSRLAPPQPRALRPRVVPRQFRPYQPLDHSAGA